MVAPPSRHLSPLLPMSAAMISGPDLIAVAVRQRPLNRVRVPFARFIQERARHRPEAVRCHFVSREAHAPEAVAHGIF